MKSIFKVFKKAFSSVKSEIIEKKIEGKKNSLTTSSTQIASLKKTSQEVRKNVLCSYNNILYCLEAKKKHFTTKDLLQVFSITGKSSNSSYKNYDLVYKDKYLKLGRNIFPLISDLNENNPLYIFDEKISEEYFKVRRMNLKDYNSNFQFYVDRIYSNKLIHNNPNLINIQKIDDYKKTHEDIFNNQFHYQNYLGLIFDNFKKRLKFKQNLEIKSDLQIPRTLPYAFSSHNNIIPFDLISTRIFSEKMDSIKDQSVLNQRLLPSTYTSFDFLRTIARNDKDPKRRYYLGVITDLLCWKFTFYIKNNDYTLENDTNFLSSKVYINDSLDFSFINEMLNFTFNLLEEKDNFDKYKV